MRISKYLKTIMPFLLLGTVLAQEDEEQVLKVVPYGVAMQPGEEVTLTCTHYPEDLTADVKLDWFRPDNNTPIKQLLANQSVINSDSDILRFQSENGTLTIVNSSLKDTGKYICRNEGGSLEIAADIKIYEMPSYSTEATIVIAINLVLVAIFIVCSLWTFLKERKQNTKSQRKQRLGHHETAKRALKDI
ncbi:uncharacterized protein LOC128219696 [Mya arenaria]|uniref:uncharacterized protein LOC128219696 n=1 Tax=Mya arenaria TaxID=6604 RepID=UPI0022E3116E|nr:uncharacterized protein LOC128219696 [Mya arenaria]XP_052783576.1 uncharacterized protein LOC128219696 [Mya arenaria]